MRPSTQHRVLRRTRLRRPLVAAALAVGMLSVLVPPSTASSRALVAPATVYSAAAYVLPAGVTYVGPGLVLGSDCGTAQHDWYDITHQRSGPAEGQTVCTFLLSGAMAREAVNTALTYGVPLGHAFAVPLLKKMGARLAPSAVNWATQSLARSLLTRLVFGKAVASTVTKMNLIVGAGEAIGILGVIFGYARLISYIRSNKACIQVNIARTGTHKVDVSWNAVYATNHFTGGAAAPETHPNYRWREKRPFPFPDVFHTETLGMTCSTDATLRVSRTVHLNYPIASAFYVRAS